MFKYTIGKKGKRTSTIKIHGKKNDLKRDSSIKEDLVYWLSKTPRERIAAIEFLRGQYHGSSEKLQ